MNAAILTAVALLGLWGPPRPPAGDIHFEGNESFTAPQLLAILQNRYYVTLAGDFGVTDADDAAYFLRTFYFSRGFREASVAYTYKPKTPPYVLFVIDEGGRNLIGTVTFEGESYIPSDRLMEIFSATVRQATLRPFGSMRYVANAVEAGRVAVVAALAQQGYLLATADVSEPAAPVNGFINLRIRIYQGLRYFVRNVTFTGSPVDDATLRGVLNEYLNQPYQRNQEALMRTRIEDWLRNHGYLDAAVQSSATLDAATGNVSADFTINAGRTYTIGQVRIENTPATRVNGTVPSRPRAHEQAVLARFGIKPGTPYDASKVDAAARRLWFSGAFSEADVQRIPRPDGTVDLLLKLAETRAKRIQFSLGYSEWDRGIGEIHYIDRNFLGSLNRLNIDGTLSQRTYGISGSLTDSWLFGSDLEGSVGAGYAHRELPAYRANEASGTLTLARNYSSTTQTGYRIQYGYKSVTDAVNFGEDPDEPDPNYTLGSVTFSQTYDTRNNILSPMKGLYLNHEVELASSALLGDVSFLRFSAQFSYYLPLREITTERPFVPFVIFNHRLGVIFPYGDTSTVPVPERFFLGGPNSVRGYQLDGLGPKDSGGDPLGGLAMILFNLELQWPVFNNIYIAAFTDAGNLWSDVQDLQLTGLQVSAGPGLRIYTPLGAVRVDYGYNVNREAGAPVGNWQFGFGFTF
jgi:outer membrane protein insertion porin family